MAHYADSINTAPRTLTDREQRLLLKTTGEHRSGFRDHVIIATALATGLRSHELLALDVGDVFYPDGRCRRSLQLRVFKRSNDDQSAQQVVLPDSLRAKLDKLLRWKQAKGEGVAPEAPLFVSRNGNRLSGRQLRESIELITRELGWRVKCCDRCSLGVVVAPWGLSGRGLVAAGVGGERWGTRGVASW